MVVVIVVDVVLVVVVGGVRYSRDIDGGSNEVIWYSSSSCWCN